MLEQEKTSKFLEAIDRAAKKHCAEIEEEIKAQSRAELQKAEDKIHDECHEKMVKKVNGIKVRTEKEIAVYSSEKDEELHKKRSDIKTEVFNKAKEKICAFTQTQAYEKLLENSANEMKKYLSEDDIVVFMRKEDMKYSEKIKAIVNAAQVREDASNKLGGIKMESQKARKCVDDTLASRLEAQNKWFNENSGLQIV